MNLDHAHAYSSLRGSYEEYHPYGSTAWWAGASATVSQKRYRFTGMERDEETGLQCHGVRYYATWLGRWVSADPIGLGDGVNRFGYCLNNVQKHRDVEGTSQTNESDPEAPTAEEQELIDQGYSLSPQTPAAVAGQHWTDAQGRDVAIRMSTSKTSSFVALAESGLMKAPTEVALPRMLAEALEETGKASVASGRERGMAYWVTAGGLEGVTDLGYGTTTQGAYNFDLHLPDDTVMLILVHGHPAATADTAALSGNNKRGKRISGDVNNWVEPGHRLGQREFTAVGTAVAWTRGTKQAGEKPVLQTGDTNFSLAILRDSSFMEPQSVRKAAVERAGTAMVSEAVSFKDPYGSEEFDKALTYSGAYVRSLGGVLYSGALRGGATVGIRW